jgi:2,3-bisphosphoglycerate-independent phosphoglycerate mutase
VRSFLAEPGSPQHAATEPFDGFNRESAPMVRLYTLTEYDSTLPVNVLFPPTFVQQHFGWALAQKQLRQLRLAETEKYPHVTWFFSGGNAEVLALEERVMVPSPKEVKTYDLKPEMSAAGVADQLIMRLEAGKTDVAIVNFANCDMVGHTGVFDAAVKAVETVDTQLGRVLKVLEKTDGAALITADHGNADQMIDYDTGEPHTLFGAPFKGVRLNPGGALCEIAPTALELLSLEPTPLMTGKSLLDR